MRFLILAGLRLWFAVSVFVGLSFQAQAEEFDVWRGALRTEALANGISAALFDEAFQNVSPIARVIELDRNQPEFTLTLSTYLQKVVSETRAKKARIRLEEHKDILAEVSAKYDVQPRFIVALWGIETNFGQHTGGFSVIAALATLAHDGRRSAYFRKEPRAGPHSRGGGEKCHCEFSRFDCSASIPWGCAQSMHESTLRITEFCRMDCRRRGPIMW